MIKILDHGDLTKMTDDYLHKTHVWTLVVIFVSAFATVWCLYLVQDSWWNLLPVILSLVINIIASTDGHYQRQELDRRKKIAHDRGERT